MIKIVRTCDIDLGELSQIATPQKHIRGMMMGPGGRTGNVLQRLRTPLPGHIEKPFKLPR